MKGAEAVYDGAYFEKYAGYAATHLGWNLNRVRLDLVERHWPRMTPLVDVGIGCGQFVESRPMTSGFDVNPAGVRWLRERDLFWDPYALPAKAASFWDSLEHIADPSVILSRISHRVFVSIPIFRDLAHVLTSKHYRTDEHFWYFTERGFLRYMADNDWAVLERNEAETTLGRDGIVSFAFRRRWT